MRARFFPHVLCFLLALMLTACVTRNPSAGNSPEELTVALTTMSPTIDRAEAARVARAVYVTSARLKKEYNHTSSPGWHNFLIAMGARKKGYCYHWTEDILAELRPLRLQTLDIHWAIADRGKDTESNALILTPKGQPLQSGIVIDSWRFGGRPFWKAAAADQSYRWEEDTSTYARARMAGVQPR